MKCKFVPTNYIFTQEQKITNLDNLINLAENIDVDKYTYNFNTFRLLCILPSLYKLKKLIGLNDIKTQIVKQIIYFLGIDNTDELLHTVIQGASGCGKTTLSYILGEIYYYMGILNNKEKQITTNNNKYNNDNDAFNLIFGNMFIHGFNDTTNTQPKKKIIKKRIPQPKINKSKSNTENLKTRVKEEIEKLKDKYKFRKVTRPDLIGEYVGQTAVKTRNLIDSIEGGVLFIDEAYSLFDGYKESFCTECMTTLLDCLTDKNRRFMCIIAGYENEIKNKLFSVNEGLERRFPFIYTIKQYNAQELFEIFKGKVEEKNWVLDENITSTFFEDNYKLFKYTGGDMETLLLKCKIITSLTNFYNNEQTNKIINKENLDNALQEFKSNKIKDDDFNKYKHLFYV